MNKAELIDAVADATDMSRAAAARALEATFEVITEALQKGDTVAISKFGTFQVRERAARQGRNPNTGQPMEIPAAKVPGFKAGKALKDAVN